MYLSGMVQARRFPFHGYTGLILVFVFWYVNWYAEGLRTHWAFFPLWIGYILGTDGLAVWRGRPSLITGRMMEFALLFVLSAPVWWLFEWINVRARYWAYLPEDAFSPLAHTLWSTLCFTTVVPAIFVTANLLWSAGILRRHHLRIKAARTPAGRMWYCIIGILMMCALFLWPSYGMAFLWVALFFITCPVNAILGRPSLMLQTAQGDWRIVILMALASLICGVFWELWNFYAWPKWIYTFPYFDGLKIFEMPLAGYLGYLPFGMEIWAFSALLFPQFVKTFSASTHVTAPSA